MELQANKVPMIIDGQSNNTLKFCYDEKSNEFNLLVGKAGGVVAYNTMKFRSEDLPEGSYEKLKLVRLNSAKGRVVRKYQKFLPSQENNVRKVLTIVSKVEEKHLVFFRKYGLTEKQLAGLDDIDLFLLRKNNEMADYQAKVIEIARKFLYLTGKDGLFLENEKRIEILDELEKLVQKYSS